MAELLTDDAPPDAIEVRRNEDGTLDEIVAEGCSVHLEQMDVGSWWLAVEKNGYRQVVWFAAPKRGVVWAISECDDFPEPGARQEERADG